MICDGVESHVPRDTFPAWIAAALRSGSSEWVEQPILVVNDLRGGLAFRTDAGSGWMRRVRSDLYKNPSVDHVHCAAPGSAESAVALDFHTVRVATGSPF